MYTFHASEPDSRPPPVSFSPPNAPPISAPEVPMLTLAMPQSLPAADRNFSAAFRFWVKIDEDRPCGTPFCMSMASSSVSYFITYRIGAKVSCCTTSSLLCRPVTIAGSTKLPGRSSAVPPVSTVPPAALALAIEARNCSTAPRLFSGPIRLAGSVGSPILPSTCL